MLFVLGSELVISDVLYITSAVLTAWRLGWGCVQARAAIAGNIKVLLSNAFFVIQLVLRLAWLHVGYPTLEDTRSINFLEIAADTCQCLALSLYIHQWFTVVVFRELVERKTDRVMSGLLYGFDAITGVSAILLIALAWWNGPAVEAVIDITFSLLLLLMEIFFLVGGILRMRFFRTTLPDRHLLRHKQLPLLVASAVGISASAVRLVSLGLAIASDSIKFVVTPLAVATVPDCALALALVFAYGH